MLAQLLVGPWSTGQQVRLQRDSNASMSIANQANLMSL
jgi:hypothetical protein